MPGDFGLIESQRRAAYLGLHQRAGIGGRNGNAGGMLRYRLRQQRGFLGNDALRLGGGIGAKAGEGRAGWPTRIQHHRGRLERHPAAADAGGQFGGSGQLLERTEPRFARAHAETGARLGDRAGLAVQRQNVRLDFGQHRIAGIGGWRGRCGGILLPCGGEHRRGRRRLSGRAKTAERGARCRHRRWADRNPRAAAQREGIDLGRRRGGHRLLAEGIGAQRVCGKRIARGQPPPGRLAGIDLSRALEVSERGPAVASRLLHMGGGEVDLVIVRKQAEGLLECTVCQSTVSRRARRFDQAGVGAPVWRGFLLLRLVNHQLEGLRGLRVHFAGLIQPGQRGKHVGIARCRGPGPL